MGKSSPSAPAAPDPVATSNAQTQSNKDTALYNFGLNNPNTTTPLGSATFTVGNSTPTYDYAAYNQAMDAYNKSLASGDSQNTGYNSTTNTYYGNGQNGTPVGQHQTSSPPTLSQFQTSSGGNPQTNENITLSPAEQAIFDTNSANTLQQGQNATTAQNNVTNLLQTPYSLQNNISHPLSQADQQGDLKNAEDSLYKQQTQYLDPQFQQGQAQLTSQLANQGIPVGSQAYNTAMNNFALQKQQAYQSAQNQATSGGAAYQAQLSQTGLANQAQEAQLYTQQYQEPLNLYSSLMSGTAPTMPQFSGVNTSQAAPTNVLGAYQNAYQGQLNSYNAAVGSSNSATAGLGSIFGSLGSLGGSLGSAAILASDKRLKKNIQMIGYQANGLPIYEFEYIWGGGRTRGLMAQDVEHVIPEAVIINSSGYKMVDYARTGA